MNLNDFKVTTTKFNMFQYPSLISENNEIKANLSLEINSPVENTETVVLSYNINSIETPIHLMWECVINLIFDEKLENTITKEELFEFSDVIFAIDSQIELISKLSNLNLPLFSQTNEE